MGAAPREPHRVRRRWARGRISRQNVERPTLLGPSEVIGVEGACSLTTSGLRNVGFNNRWHLICLIWHLIWGALAPDLVLTLRPTPPISGGRSWAW